jgi:UPF0716 protein FxsA
MGLLLFFLLVALPFVELAVLVQVAGEVGAANTIGLVLLVSLAGVWLAKRAGLGVVARMRRTQAEGELPSRELMDGALILVAAVLLVIPGFVTDVVGILLLLPPVRVGVRTLALQRIRTSDRFVVVGTGGLGGPGPAGAAGARSARRRGGEDVWDVESWEESPSRRPSGELGDGLP